MFFGQRSEVLSIRVIYHLPLNMTPINNASKCKFKCVETKWELRNYL